MLDWEKDPVWQRDREGEKIIICREDTEIRTVFSGKRVFWKILVCFSKSGV